MTDVASDVIAIIGKKARVSRPHIELDDRLEELGLESLDAVEMIFDIEEKFDIRIDYNANDTERKFETVRDVVDAIKILVAAKRPSA